MRDVCVCMYVCIIVGDGLGVCCARCKRIMCGDVRRDAHDCV